MKGKNVSEFMDELYVNPEMELVYHSAKYLISGFVDDKGHYTISVDLLGENGHNIFDETSINRNECVAKFEEAKLFEGLSIYEAEQDIEVLYG